MKCYDKLKFNHKYSPKKMNTKEKVPTITSAKEPLNFDGKTIVITGSTRGIGYGYAQYFAALGANVVINGVNERNVQAALDSLESSDGKVCGITCPVEKGEEIIEYALSEFSRINAVINNAGIVKDAQFKNLTVEDWGAIYKNHLEASFRIAKAVWPHFLKAGGGRILFTSSSAGIFGNYGQSNYSAAKAGIIGLAKTLAIEGKKHDIKVNSICPGAYTEMSAALMDQSIIDDMSTDKVSPVAAWLCHEACPDSGAIIEAAGGWIAKVRCEYNEMSLDGDFSIENIRDIWPELSAFETKVTHPSKLSDSMRSIAGHIKRSKEKVKETP